MRIRSPRDPYLRPGIFEGANTVGYVNPNFAAQYNGSYQAGLIRGAYHFATVSR
jgi:GH25 family lysozyme M1 (1,4-beta-N-acetylmuramidase)